MEGEGIQFLAGLFLFLILFVGGILLLISLWKIFKKANKPGWASLIPIYNGIVLIQIGGKPAWWFLLLLIPFVNIVITIMIFHNLSKAFGKGSGFTLGLIFLPIIFFPILAFGDAQLITVRQIQKPIMEYDIQNQQTPKEEISINASSVNKKTPTILSDLIKPGLPAKIFTAFFMDDRIVFAKTGSGSTNIEGTQRAFHGGFGASAAIMGGIGALMDYKRGKQRGDYAGEIASFSSEDILIADKNNFQVFYGNVSAVEVKGPNFAGELKIVVRENGNEHKFRMDKQSKDSANYIVCTFNQFIPNKVVRN